jgi:hypothetical protein
LKTKAVIIVAKDLMRLYLSVVPPVGCKPSAYVVPRRAANMAAKKKVPPGFVPFTKKPDKSKGDEKPKPKKK